jgi:hypothetical protein
VSTVLDPTIDTVSWEDLQPPCEAKHRDTPCPRSAEWVAENVACSCDPAPYTVCAPHHERMIFVPLTCSACETRADLRWERL